MRDAAVRIRDAMAAVGALRLKRDCEPALAVRVDWIKQLQANRFRGSYRDILSGGRYKDAAYFFLSEIYGAGDFSSRDQQFARIAGTIERLFPEPVVETCVALAEVHALTEGLDNAMALALESASGVDLQPADYVRAWRFVGRESDRAEQLRVVLLLGRQLDRLTRAPGLRLALRMMRGPAHAAGLESLQSFLESGFDTFAGMRGADGFLGRIEQTERAAIDMLFNAPFVACETQLVSILGQAR